jgi:hypothetical protein
VHRSATVLVPGDGAAFGPPPGTRTPRVIGTTVRTSEDDEEYEDDEYEQKRLSTGKT